LEKIEKSTIGFGNAEAARENEIGKAAEWLEKEIGIDPGD
jgi:hypothetical protein